MSETTVISAEIIKKAMRIRSGIIIGYPNPCAYTDRFQEEYNALAVYLAVHYPDDKEISTYAPVFTEISTWEENSITEGLIQPVSQVRYGRLSKRKRMRW